MNLETIQKNLKIITLLTIILGLESICLLMLGYWFMPLISFYILYDSGSKFRKINKLLKFKGEDSEMEMKELRKFSDTLPIAKNGVILFLVLYSLFTAYALINPFGV